MKHFVWLASACLTLGLLAGGLTVPLDSQAQGDDPLVLLDTIEVGGRPETILVDCQAERNDVIFYDLSGGKVRFIDGDTLTLAPEEISLPSWGFDGWMAYDRYHHQTYVLQVRSRYPGPWYEVLVHVVAGRSRLDSFSVNESYNTPVPQDDSYSIDGLAFKQPLSEAAGPGRLIIDNTRGGNIDVVDLNAAGTDVARVQRYSYRDAIAGTVYLNSGNSLALETQHETLAVDDLASTDILYIADKNHPWVDGYGYIRVLRLNHPLEELDATLLPELDLNDTWPFGNGFQGIAMAGRRDILYVASGMQSFDNGYVAEVDTTDNQLAQVVNLTYGDESFVHVDWHDPKRVFVATFDGFDYYDPYQGLYLHLIYDGTVVDTLRLMENYEEDDLRGMAFDPYHRRLYLTMGSSVMVVQVNYGRDPLAVASAVISPDGGALYTPDDSARLDFPPDAVDQPTVVTYMETEASPPGGLFGVRFFELSAAISGTTTPVTSTNRPYTVTVNYTDAERGPAIESTLGLYWWDGSTWSQQGITSTVDTVSNVVTAQVDHFSLFTVAGLVCHDFDGNRQTDVNDIMAVVAHWRQQHTHPEDWDPRFDLDEDGDVDIVDVMRVAAVWGSTCS